MVVGIGVEELLASGLLHNMATSPSALIEAGALSKPMKFPTLSELVLLPNREAGTASHRHLGNGIL